MAYNMIRVCPRRTFTGTGLTNTTGTMTITVAERIDISQAIEVDLYARLHSASLTAGNSFTVKLVEDYFDSNDPGTIWIVATSLITLTAFDSTTTAPTAFKGSASTANPRFAAVQIALAKTASGANFTADISIDITLKINNGTYMPAPNTFAGYRY